MKYEIQVRSHHWASQDWKSPDGMNVANKFDCEEEALAAIESLKALGKDWDEAEYWVREKC